MDCVASLLLVDDGEREAFNRFASSMSNTFLRERGYTSGGIASPPPLDNCCFSWFSCSRVTVDDFLEVVVVRVAWLVTVVVVAILGCGTKTKDITPPPPPLLLLSRL